MQTLNHAPVRLAILGAGTIGTIHGLASLEAPEATVKAVWSRSPHKAQELARRVSATAYESLEDAIADPQVDAVLICTPTFLHQEHALAAIRAGKHVFCEKPLARDLASARAIAEAAAEAGVLLYVGHVVRFFPEFVRLRELILQGQVGRPAVVHMSRAASFPRGSGDWHNDLEQSGGVVLDMGLHDLDWLLWTFGPAERIYGRGLYQARLPFLDYALLTLRFRSGVMAEVECSWAETEGFRVHGEVAGDGGLLTYDSLNSTALQIALRRPPEAPPGVNVPTAYTAESPYVSQLRHFARCVLGAEQPRVTPQEALEALRLALAALASITDGRPMAL